MCNVHAYEPRGFADLATIVSEVNNTSGYTLSDPLCSSFAGSFSDFKSLEQVCVHSRRRSRGLYSGLAVTGVSDAFLGLQAPHRDQSASLFNRASAAASRNDFTCRSSADSARDSKIRHLLQQAVPLIPWLKLAVSGILLAAFLCCFLSVLQSVVYTFTADRVILTAIWPMLTNSIKTCAYQHTSSRNFPARTAVSIMTAAQSLLNIIRVGTPYVFWGINAAAIAVFGPLLVDDADDVDWGRAAAAGVFFLYLWSSLQHIAECSHHVITSCCRWLVNGASICANLLMSAFAAKGIPLASCAGAVAFPAVSTMILILCIYQKVDT